MTNNLKQFIQNVDFYVKNNPQQHKKLIEVLWNYYFNYNDLFKIKNLKINRHTFDNYCRIIEKALRDLKFDSIPEAKNFEIELTNWCKTKIQG